MFIGGFCKVKISSPGPQRGRREFQMATAGCTGTPSPSSYKGPVCTLRESGVAGGMG